MSILAFFKKQFFKFLFNLVFFFSICFIYLYKTSSDKKDHETITLIIFISLGFTFITMIMPVLLRIYADFKLNRVIVYLSQKGIIPELYSMKYKINFIPFFYNAEHAYFTIDAWEYDVVASVYISQYNSKLEVLFYAKSGKKSKYLNLNFNEISFKNDKWSKQVQSFLSEQVG